MEHPQPELTSTDVKHLRKAVEKLQTIHRESFRWPARLLQTRMDADFVISILLDEISQLADEQIEWFRDHQVENSIDNLAYNEDQEFVRDLLNLPEKKQKIIDTYNRLGDVYNKMRDSIEWLPDKDPNHHDLRWRTYAESCEGRVRKADSDKLFLRCVCGHILTYTMSTLMAKEKSRRPRGQEKIRMQQLEDDIREEMYDVYHGKIDDEIREMKKQVNMGENVDAATWQQ
eukprot:434234-Rhodomonas_salina.1